MEGIFAWIYHNLSFFSKEMGTYSLNGYQLVLLQMYSINTVMLEDFNLNMIWNWLKNTNMLFFRNKIINIDDNHMKAAEFKVYHGLNNALGICVHEKYCPSFAHPDGTDICSGPWTNVVHTIWTAVGMMTSSNGNIFRVTGPLCGEFTDHRWIPHRKASDAKLWCFLWFASK